MVPTRDTQQRNKHAHRIAQQTHFRAFAVRPVHGHFRYPVSETQRDMQYLDVEAETVFLASRENLSCRFLAEQFETALRVMDARHR
jgi:hypothetical protein